MYNIETLLTSSKQWAANTLSREQLISLSRKIKKDNVFIAALDKNFLSLILSQGINCSFTTDNNTVARDVFEDFQNAPSIRGDEDINEFLRRIIFSVITDGDCLVYVTSRKDYSDYDYDDELEEYVYKDKLKLGFIQSTRVQSPSEKTKILHSKTDSIVDLSKYAIVDGCVMEKGQIIGYCVSDNTGKDISYYYPRTFGKYFSSVLLRSPLPTGDANSIRGIPMLAPAIKALDDVTKLINAEVKSQTVKTKLALKTKVTADEPSVDEINKIKTDITSVVSELSTSDANIWFEAPGSETTAFDHKNNQQTQIDYLIIPLIKFISGLYGVAYDALTKDLSNASGATARALYSQAFADTEIWRKQIYTQILNPVMFLLLESVGIDPKSSEWQYSVKPFGYLKSKEEYDANKLAIDTKQRTLYEVITSYGYTPEEMIKQDEYLLNLAREYNPLAGINVDNLTSVLEKYNNGTLTKEQCSIILESWKLNPTKYLGNGA